MQRTKALCAIPIVSLSGVNRQTGAYFAHEVRAEVPFDHVQVLSGISTNTIVLDEAGFCTPETPQRPRF